MPLLTIARNAFLESIRQPIHSVIICAAVLALILNVNVAGYTLEDDNKLLIDLGLSTLFLSGIVLAASTATSVLAREIDNKTVITVVSKPVPRPFVVLGKFFGVVGASGLAFWLLSLVFLLTVRHRVQSSVRAEDIFDGPVITFGLLAIVLTFVIAGLANYLYRWPFPSTFSVAGAVMATVACAIVACISRSWRLQSPADSVDPQIALAIVLVFEAVVVLTAIAIAASTRLGQIPTLLVCVGMFLIGLVGEYFLSLAVSGRPWMRQAAGVVPNLQFFWPADAITQGSTITAGYVGLVTLYACCLVGAVMGLSVILFQTRDVG